LRGFTQSDVKANAGRSSKLDLEVKCWIYLTKPREKRDEHPNNQRRSFKHKTFSARSEIIVIILAQGFTYKITVKCGSEFSSWHFNYTFINAKFHGECRLRYHN